MKIFSWNVNGIRAAKKKGFDEWFLKTNADIVCLQEVRALPDQVELDFPGYTTHWNPAEKKGYSGTAVLTRVDFSNIFTGMPGFFDDSEGRVISAELKNFYLVTVYTPNSQRGLLRLDYRTTKWDTAFKKHLKSLAKKKPVIVCGDLNVAHMEIDLANPDSNHKNAGFTDAERSSFQSLLDAGFSDTFRLFTSEGGHYTWWSNFNNARSRNIGWRIDYFLAGKEIASSIINSQIHDTVKGSDHCPVSIEINENYS